MNSYVHWERAGSALVFWISFFGFSPAVCSNDASPLCADSMAAASLQCTIFTTNTHQRKTNIGLESSAHDIRDQTFFLFSSRGNCVLSSSSLPERHGRMFTSTLEVSGAPVLPRSMFTAAEKLRENFNHQEHLPLFLTSSWADTVLQHGR